MSERYFPFTRLGYRCNPFRVATKEEFGALGVLPEGIRPLLEGTASNLQLLGERGRGKTSILLRLLAHFREEGINVAYEYLPPGQRAYSSALDDLDLLLLDEFQRLGRRARAKLILRARSRDRAGLWLIISSHVDAAAAFQSFNKPLETLHLSSLGKSHARKVLERRQEYFSLPDGATARLSDDAFDLLWERYGDDLRAIEAALYEAFQQLLDRQAPSEKHLLEALRVIVVREARG